MKDLVTLLGFGVGVVTGAMLYKYSKCTQEAIDKGEKMVMKEVDNMEQKAKAAVKNAQKKAEKETKKD